MQAAPRTEAASSRALPGRTERFWLLLFGSYFALQMGLRWAIGTSLNWDEAEALYFARHLDWGYGPQPPLYFWLQWATIQLLGPGVLALAALKNLVLAGFLASVFLLLRRDVEATAAGGATLALGLILALSWEGQRALTHSALALLMAPLTAAATLRALRRGRWTDHALLGLAVGFGLLSKLNMAIWDAGLLAAALLLPEWRQRIRPVRVLAAVGLAVAMNGPALLWGLSHPALATSSLGKLNIEASGLSARLTGTGSLVEAILTFYSLPLVALGLLWGLTRVRPRPLPPGLRMVGVAALLSLLLLWVGVLLSGSTRIDYMWLLPFGWPLVPLAVLAFWPELHERGRRSVAAAGGSLWLLALVALPGASFATQGSVNRWLDYGPLASHLRDLQGDGTPILLTNVPLAGNLVLREPTLDIGLLTAASPNLPGKPVLLVGRIDDPLLASPEVAARTIAVERFDPLADPGPRQVAVVHLRSR